MMEYQLISKEHGRTMNVVIDQYSSQGWTILAGSFTCLILHCEPVFTCVMERVRET